ncbi:hypothetical protein HY382_00080 [Candidatus Curtissbacteria bacterium]|nr:hypothetical protein [Candidatus Curtissbacteria bacterium]
MPERIGTLDFVEVQKLEIDLRRQKLAELRSENNLPFCPLPEGNMHVMLLDNKFYGNLLEAIEEDAKVEQTAEHEIGHALVAKALGWEVQSMTVVARGNTLGMTITMPTNPMSFENWLYQSAAISLGGGIAAEMANHKAHGCGSDMAYATALANLAVSRGFSTNTGQFLSKAKNLAKSALSGYGVGIIRSSAKNLFAAKTVA